MIVPDTINNALKSDMEPAPQSGNIFHRAVHIFVYGLCSVYFGITPPPEEKELRFMGLLLGAVIVLAMLGTLFGWYLIQAVTKY